MKRQEIEYALMEREDRKMHEHRENEGKEGAHIYCRDCPLCRLRMIELVNEHPGGVSISELVS